MSLTSAQLANQLHDQGLLSKEAKERVLAVRRKLYKKALEKHAAGVFDWILDRGRSLASNFSYPGLKNPELPVHPAGATISRVDPRSGAISHIPIGGQPIEGARRPPMSWTDMVGNLAKLTILGTGVGAAQSGVIKAIEQMSANKEQAITKRELAESFDQMFEEQPALKTSDPERVQRHFDVLAKYAPSLAKDPTIASNWVKQTVDMRFIDADSINRLASTEKLIRQGSGARDLFDEAKEGLTLVRTALGGSDKQK